MNIFDNYEAAIFDMDGTLIDSMSMWEEIDVEFLGKRNLSIPNTLHKDIEGKSFHETAVFFRDFFNLPESVEEIENIWNTMSYEKYSHGMKAKKGALEFIKALKEHNFKIGIATSNHINLAKVCFDSLGIIDMLDTIVTSDCVKKSKPNPDVYLKAARNLNIDPSKCIVFEDVPMGIMAGINAGMDTCAIYDDFTASVDLQKRNLAKYYINDYFDIINNNYCL